VSEAPVCSVVVPSYRSAATIRDCLDALLRQEQAPPYEMIVVDSSEDGTAEIVRGAYPAVRLIHLPSRTGPEVARNLGAEQARGDVLAFIDSDCIAPRDWLRRLHGLVACGYEAVGGSTVNGNGQTLVSWASYICEFREFLPDGQPRNVNYISPNNAAYRTAAFRAAGGFPAGYYPMEDQIFHRYFRERGISMRLDPRIAVAHFHRTRRRDFLEHQRRIGRANARVLRLIELPGGRLARHPWLAALAMPALILYRFVRTAYACRGVERGLMLRRPALAWLCWLGMCWWGCGFLEGAFGCREPAA
jgi:glycosyltransferase involved in cell wall biosynthesis